MSCTITGWAPGVLLNYPGRGLVGAPRVFRQDPGGPPGDWARPQGVGAGVVGGSKSAHTSLFSAPDVRFTETHGGLALDQQHIPRR